MLDFIWDAEKAEKNFRKHGVRFEVAALVFLDPDLVSEIERFVAGEERWQTIGEVDGRLLLMVAHTVLVESDEAGIEKELIRIISAREAGRKERQRYGQDR